MQKYILLPAFFQLIKHNCFLNSYKRKLLSDSFSFLLGNFNLKSVDVITKGVTAVYANKGLNTKLDVSLAGFLKDKPQSMMFVFGDILLPQTYAEIKN